MYASCFKKMFWAMIFIIFNINLGKINILPNFIRYMLIYSALNILESQHEIYRKGKIPAVVLSALTLRDIFGSSSINILSGQNHTVDIWLMLLGAVIAVLDIYLIYIICRGIYLVADCRELLALKQSAETRLNYYILISGVMTFYTPFSMNIPRHYNTLMIIGAVLYIMAALFITGLFRKAMEGIGEY